MKSIPFFIAFLISVAMLAQVPKQSSKLRAKMMHRVGDTTSVVIAQNEAELQEAQWDSLVENAINLNEVFVVSAFKFKNRAERRRYLILNRKTQKVWPYAVLAADRLTELNNRLSKLESKADKRRYTRIVQDYIQDEFTDQLKKLTKTEGQILVKLMYRQTGETTFNVVKELKSGWRAFWYNTTASLFNISLKKEYHPEDVEEDYLIEHILRRGFQKKEIENHEPAIKIDFIKSMERWN